MIDLTGITFTSLNLPDFWEESGTTSYRLTEKDLAEMPEDTKNIDALKVQLYDLMHEKLGSYAKLELLCDIKTDTFQKVMRLKKGRNVTYPFLAKFCIGANLGESKARELFAMMGHHLSEENRCDYILLHELRNHGTLEDYDADMVAFGYDSVISQPD